jgi:hypothetical protein
LSSLSGLILDEQQLVEEFFFGVGATGGSLLKQLKIATPSTVTIDNIGTSGVHISSSGR